MPSWLSDWVGTDMAPLAYYALVAVILLVLIVVVLAIAKKVMGGGGAARIKSRGPRLAVMDVAAIDPKRKLVLIRRDEIEHLLLIGGQNDLVVEASILRVPAAARVQRTEPTMRADVDLADDAERAARQPAPMRPPEPETRPRRPASAPAPVAAQPPMPAPPVAPRAAEPGRASPLSRTIPQPAPVAPPRARPVAAVPVEPPALAPAPARPPVQAGAPADEIVPPEADRLIGAAPSPVPVVPVASPEAAEPAAPPMRAAPRVQPVERNEAETPPAPPVQPVVRSRVTAEAPSVEAAGAGERPVAAPSDTAQERPAAPAPRVAIGGNAGAPPVRRPLPVLPIQPRSMATPTVPARPAPTPADATTAAAATPSAGPEGTGRPATAIPSDDAVLVTQPPKAPGSAGGPDAPLAEPKTGPSLDLQAANAPPERAASSGSPVVVPPIDAGERRPLSVRSFASAIQTRQQPEPAPAPVVVAVPVVAPAALAESASRRSDREPVTGLLPGPAGRLVAPVHAAAVPVAADADDSALEDFLSAQLNSELGDDIWSADEAPPKAPAARDEAPDIRPAPDIRAERRSDAGANARVEPVRLDPPAKPRTLTLEEEMERLLGDFDLETTDRRNR